MSRTSRDLKRIEDLDETQLAEALKMNGYAACVGAIQAKHIDGHAFLKLTEHQLSFWRLPSIEARRLWSFMQQVKQDPTQFLTNHQIRNKTAPKVNSFDKSPVNDTVIYGNTESTSNFLNNKRNICAKPNIFQKTAQTEGKNSSTLIQQENKLLKDNRESETTSEGKESNSSTLNKHKNNLFKNKLEQMLKKDPSEASNSFLHNPGQPVIPPKPDHLKVTAQNAPEEASEDYLEPKIFDPNQSKDESQILESERRPTLSRRGSFLNKFRKNYDNLEIRPPVVPNEYEEKTTNHKAVITLRPLPPLPIETRKSSTLEADDEHLVEYTSVPDDEEPIVKKEMKGIPDRCLPPITIQQAGKINRLLEAQKHRHPYLNVVEDDVELAEYTSVIEDDERENEGPLSHKTSRPPLPPLNIPVSSTPIPKIRERAKLPSPEADKDLSPQQQPILRPTLIKLDAPFSTLPKGSTTSSKSGAHLLSFATLPKTNLLKSTAYLPKPPVALPSPTNFPNKSQSNFPDFSFCDSGQLPLPPMLKTEAKAMEAEDEQSFYTEIDLARESSYRETDRKGARQLLTGLTDGAFVIRPSRQPEYICTISIMHSTKMFNLGVERDSSGALTFGSVMPDFEQPKFYSVAEIITYYSLNPLYISGQSIFLKDILPRNRH